MLKFRRPCPGRHAAVKERVLDLEITPVVSFLRFFFKCSSSYFSGFQYYYYLFACLVHRPTMPSLGIYRIKRVSPGTQRDRKKVVVFVSKSLQVKRITEGSWERALELRLSGLK